MKYILDGAYGFDNLGDEAMLHTAICALRNAKPELEICVSSYKPSKIKDFHGVEGSNAILPGTLLRNLKKLRFGNIRRQLFFIHSLDALIFAGGSILNDKKGIRGIVVIFYKVLLFRMLGEKVIFWGVAHDKLDSKIASIMLKIVMLKANLVVFRDDQSLKLVEASVGSQKHIESGVDILFGLLPILKNFTTDDLVEGSKIYRIGLSLRPYPPNTGYDLDTLDASLCEQVAEYLGRVSSSLNRKLVVVPLIFSEGTGAKNDRAMIARVEKLIPHVEFNWPDIGIGSCKNGEFELLLKQYCALISKLDLVVGERFQSLVLAQILEAPYIAISYDKKIDELIKITNMQAYELDLLSGLEEKTVGSVLSMMTEQSLVNGNELKSELRMNNSELLAQSLKDQASVKAAL